MRQCLEMMVIAAVASPYGIRYVVSGILKTPANQVPLPLVLAVWQQDTGAHGVRLITAYPG